MLSFAGSRGLITAINSTVFVTAKMLSFEGVQSEYKAKTNFFSQNSFILSKNIAFVAPHHEQ